MNDRPLIAAETRVLIAPGDTALGRVLVNLEADAGNLIVAALENDASAINESGDGNESRRIDGKWNRRSLLSARNLVLQGLNTFGKIDKAILIHECRQDERSIHELSPTAIDRSIDESLKGIFFLLRELMSYFVRQGTGNLAMVHYSPGDYTKLPLDAAFSAAFRAATDSLCTLYQNEEITINGFECFRERPDDFGKFILQSLAGRAASTKGKCYRYGAVSRLFH